LVGKNDVLIIEDSLATAMLIHDFLKKLGYENVHTCNTGKAGMKKFEELAKSDHLPIVLLDYNLPDMNASEVMLQLFNVKSDAKVILETAEEKDDETVKDALRHGAYLYLQKPIRFENLKNVIKILEDEKKVLNDQPSEEQHGVEYFLKTNTRISLKRLAEYSKKQEADVMAFLKELEDQGRVSKIESIKEISCSNCGSVRISQYFFCPSCHSSNFKQGKLIEHFKCGNVSIDDTYKDSICPKCRKEIKIIGVDYRAIENYYICIDCGEKFPEPAQDYICVKCNNRFTLEHAHWVTSEGFALKTTN